MLLRIDFAFPSASLLPELMTIIGLHKFIINSMLCSIIKNVIFRSFDIAMILSTILFINVGFTPAPGSSNNIIFGSIDCMDEDALLRPQSGGKIADVPM